MSWIDAIILGLVQGLTEFLPVSSSGHLELGKYFLNIESGNSLAFTVAVHGATVLSILIVFRKDIICLLKGSITFKWNMENQYILKIIISMIPVGILGLFLQENIEKFFTKNIRFVGSMLVVTAILLALSHFARAKNKKLNYLDAFIIGLSQGFAVLPGISRSGATIVTGLLLGIKKEEVAKFSFLMIVIPVIGANLKDVFSGDFTDAAGVGLIPIVIGFFTAFISGLLACKWMINLVKRGKLVNFSAYCFLLGNLSKSLNIREKHRDHVVFPFDCFTFYF
ncbi:Undecaprenyl-diphosphatase [subsurface metagenome]